MIHAYYYDTWIDSYYSRYYLTCARTAVSLFLSFFRTIDRSIIPLIVKGRGSRDSSHSAGNERNAATEKTEIDSPPSSIVHVAPWQLHVINRDYECAKAKLISIQTILRPIVYARSRDRYADRVQNCVTLFRERGRLTFRYHSFSFIRS